MEIKQSVSLKVPVRLRAVIDGSPLAGVTYSQAVVYYQKQGGLSVAKPLGPSDWVEVDAVNMPGEYDLVLTAPEVDTLGFLKYTVAYPGLSLPYAGLLQVVANIASDIMTMLGNPQGANPGAPDISQKLEAMYFSLSAQGTNHTTATQFMITQVYDRLGAPTGANISADIAAIDAGLTAVGDAATRTLALSYDNVYQDQQVYDAGKRLTSARLRCYDSSAHAAAHGLAGLLYTYTISATYAVDGTCTIFSMTRSP